MRVLDPRELCHDRLADRFGDLLSDYDTRRRLDTLVDEFLPAGRLAGATVLDVGCGLGQFSERLQARGAKVTATDIGTRLLDLTRERVGCECVQADALDLATVFGEDRFDIVLSSECISENSTWAGYMGASPEIYCAVELTRHCAPRSRSVRRDCARAGAAKTARRVRNAATMAARRLLLFWGIRVSARPGGPGGTVVLTCKPRILPAFTAYRPPEISRFAPVM